MALALFNEDEGCKEKGEPATMTGFSTASGKPLKPVSERAQKAAFALFEKTEDALKEKPNTTYDGIKTAAGKSLNRPSKTSVQAASRLFGDEKEKSEGQSHYGLKRPNDHLIDPELNFESVLDKYGGFLTGNSKKQITVSSRAKKEAISMFEKDSTVPGSPQSASIVPEITTAPKQVVHNTPAKASSNVKQTIPNQLGRSKRFKTSQKQNKPFKSPIIRSNIELTKAAINNKSNSKSKGQPVFDLTRKLISDEFRNFSSHAFFFVIAPKYRYKLSSLGSPLSYSREQLIFKNM
jgi:hypothetical protein